MRVRHKIFWEILRPLVVVFLRIRFGYTYEKAKGLPEKYIVLSNHATDYDPLLVGASFPRQIYFVASEHVARWGFLSKVLDYVFAFIVRYKGTVASSTVKEILRRVKAGGSVCVFAEGDRCWDGVTQTILPSTGKFVKTARCGLVTYRIQGGYFTSPRWSSSSKTRKGYLHGEVVRVYTAEEVAAMSVDEVNAVIARDLHEDAYARQLESPRRYKCKEPAEGMENLLFLCPRCGAVDTMRSAGDTVSCAHCGHSFRYDEYGALHGTDCATVKELAAWQKERIAAMAAEGAVLTSPDATLTRIVKHEELPVDSGKVSMSADGITCGDTAIPMADISILSMHGKRGIVFSAAGSYYELKPAIGSNALKFQLLYDAYKQI